MPTAAGRRAGRGARPVRRASVRRQGVVRHLGQYHDGACAPRAGHSAGCRKNLRQAGTKEPARGRWVAGQPASAQWPRESGQGGELRERSRESTAVAPGNPRRVRRAGARPSPPGWWRWREAPSARNVLDRRPAVVQPAWDPTRLIAPPHSGVSQTQGGVRPRTVDRARARNSRLYFRPTDVPSKP
jgi:hypothetical protein